MLECAIAWDVRRVTIASTIGVYGGVPELRGVREELPLEMASGGNVVAASKKSAELVVSLFRERGVDAISTRLPAVWGPRGRKESRFFAAPGLIHAAVNGHAPPTTYADDAIDLLVCQGLCPGDRPAADRRPPHPLDLQRRVRPGNVQRGGGGGHQARRPRRRTPARARPESARRGGLPGYHASPAETGFAPEYDLDRAVADYVSWLTND